MGNTRKTNSTNFPNTGPEGPSPRGLFLEAGLRHLSRRRYLSSHPTTVRMEDDMKRYGGGTRPYDAVLERKRQAIRRALKMQYVKTIYDPRNYERNGAPRIFDANM